MTTLEKKIDICLRWIINDDPNELAVIKSEAYSALNDCACHSKNDIHSAVVSLLKELGISQHLTGFNQLVCAIELVIEDESYMRNIFNGLYPAVAERTGSNAHRAERNIDTLLRMVWTKAMLISGILCLATAFIRIKVDRVIASSSQLAHIT